MKYTNKEARIMVRMDINLKKQLENYADRNDEGNISLSARRAIKQFLLENK